MIIHIRQINLPYVTIMQVYLPNVVNGLLQFTLGKFLPSVNIRQALVA